MDHARSFVILHENQPVWILRTWCVDAGADPGGGGGGGGGPAPTLFISIVKK